METTPAEARDSGVDNQVAMFLLPEGTTVGSRLVREVLEWRLLS